MKLLYFFLHMFDCPEESIVEDIRGKCKCTKCGREYFKFTTYS